MWLLILSALNICHNADEFIDLNIVNSTLNVKLQVLVLVAEELSMLNNYADFLREPVGCSPYLLRLGRV
jgi:hypothetical protein